MINEKQSSTLRWFYLLTNSYHTQTVIDNNDIDTREWCSVVIKCGQRMFFYKFRPKIEKATVPMNGLLSILMNLGATLLGRHCL